MIRLLRETDYAVRILRILAKSKTPLVSLHQMSDETKISFMFLQKIARKLRLGGIIKSEQGIKGGYKLAIPANELSLHKIVSVMEGQIALLPCLGDKKTCEHKIKCSLSKKVSVVNTQLVKMLEKVKLNQL